jgi:hypothetical protein
MLIAFGLFTLVLGSMAAKMLVHDLFTFPHHDSDPADSDDVR